MFTKKSALTVIESKDFDGDTVEVLTPFEGFYGFYDDLSDDIFRSEFDYLVEEQGHNENAVNEALYKHYNNSEFMRAVAECWLDNWQAFIKSEFDIELNILGADIDSPQFYNFSNDRLFVTIPAAQWLELYKKVPVELLENQAKKMFTSCDGFISSYSNNWHNLFKGADNINELDHNELGVLFEAIHNEHKDESIYFTDMVHEYFHQYDVFDWPKVQSDLGIK